MTTRRLLSHDSAVSLLETADIGGTNAATPWVSMKEFKEVYAYVELGTWDAGDDLDECRLEQATDASDGDYDTDAPIDADGNFVILEASREDLDSENGFTHVRLKVAEGGNTGVDNVTGFLLRYGARSKNAQKNGDAVTGSKVYVTPS